ncbi:ZIP Zinc transporter family protein [Tritrichomonas foetus]|uniref:ZIP Zinc transporter family protein n=1 Tax=Tritrichomonas foetus TaxID=1144522 RepID=A0A1J4JST1_9EUKA|nr:ZIP Zinc transporter family protein [Tritrichomonas foetus]|eukprot:OHT02115.1 ZIP Zinc transporter family protein [Tritrichomonas foetus]
MELFVFKYISAIICLVMTAIGSLLPMFIHSPSWSHRLESLAAGVFLGAGFGHLLHDSTEEFIHAGQTSFPCASSIALATFAVLSAIDFFTGVSEKGELLKFSESNDNDDIDCSCHSTYSTDNHDIENPENLPTPDAQVEEVYSPSTINDNNEPSNSNNEDLNDDNSKDFNISDEKKCKKYRITKPNDNTSHQSNEYNKKPKHSIKEHFSETMQCLSISMISLYILLCVHCIIEGLAMGITSTWRSSVALMCAIVSHKPVEAFALGLILIKSKPTMTLYITLMIAVAMMTPIGAIIAINISSLGSHVTIGIISAFSAGTFLYVGFNEWAEMISHKIDWPINEKFWNYGLFTIGIIFMILIALA